MVDQKMKGSKMGAPKPGAPGRYVFLLHSYYLPGVPCFGLPKLRVPVLKHAAASCSAHNYDHFKSITRKRAEQLCTRTERDRKRKNQNKHKNNKTRNKKTKRQESQET